MPSLPTAESSFALLSYSTHNVGDEIQSIAARQFLPRVDHYVDRDELNRFQIQEGASAKAILNGWYTHVPNSWPPSESIDPLLVAMHIDANDRAVAEAFASPRSISYLKEHGPVGARDPFTENYLRGIGVDAYFSGCLTLTLRADARISKSDHIVLLDAGKQVEDAVRANTDRPIISTTALTRTGLSNHDRFRLAELYLCMYQSAHLVITTRLHAMLPSLALGSHVAFIDRPGVYKPERVAALKRLVHSFDTPREFVSMRNLPGFLSSPPPNPDDYIQLRDDIESRAVDFTGYRAASFLAASPEPNVLTDPGLMRLAMEGIGSRVEIERLGSGLSFLKNYAKRVINERYR